MRWTVEPCSEPLNQSTAIWTNFQRMSQTHSFPSTHHSDSVLLSSSEVSRMQGAPTLSWKNAQQAHRCHLLAISDPCPPSTCWCTPFVTSNRSSNQRERWRPALGARKANRTSWGLSVLTCLCRCWQIGCDCIHHACWMSMCFQTNAVNVFISTSSK